MKKNYIEWKLCNKIVACAKRKTKKLKSMLATFLSIYCVWYGSIQILLKDKAFVSLLKSVCERFAQNWNPDKASKYEQISNQNKEICVQICLSLFSFAAKKNNQQCGTLIWNILSLLKGKRRRNKGITHNKQKKVAMPCSYMLEMHLAELMAWLLDVVWVLMLGMWKASLKAFLLIRDVK